MCARDGVDFSPPVLLIFVGCFAAGNDRLTPPPFISFHDDGPAELWHKWKKEKKYGRRGEKPNHPRPVHLSNKKNIFRDGAFGKALAQRRRKSKFW